MAMPFSPSWTGLEWGAVFCVLTKPLGIVKTRKKSSRWHCISAHTFDFQSPFRVYGGLAEHCLHQPFNIRTSPSDLNLFARFFVEPLKISYQNKSPLPFQEHLFLPEHSAFFSIHLISSLLQPNTNGNFCAPKPDMSHWQEDLTSPGEI